MASRTVVIIGGGHAGLAMSRCLAEDSIDHVVLERGEVASSWKTQRWDSLRLLTPNWQSRLPGYAYRGDDPDGFMTMPEVIGFIEGYAKEISAPVETQTEVTSLRRTDRGYRVETNRGIWDARAAVIASGACRLPKTPNIELPASLEAISALEYRRPDALPDGGVLVVGASASGIQIAHEIHRSGRPVTVAVGEHVRMPRIYRSLDVQWWMDASGLLDVRYDEVEDLERARNVASPQLVGTPERMSLNLNTLTDLGVRLVGRLVGARDARLQFSGSLRNVVALADLKMNRMLNTFDEWAEESGRAGEFTPIERFERTRLETEPPLTLAASEFKSVVWATGFRPDHSWVDLPVFDRKGRIRHDGGVVEEGLYLLGATFLRRRKSSFIHGTGDDARDLTEHLVGHLAEKLPTPTPKKQKK